MAPGGEPLAHHGDDPAGHAGERGRELDVVGHGLEEAAGLLRLVLPGDAEQVHGVHIPEAQGFEPVLNLLRDGLRVLHLGDGGDHNAVFLRLFDIVGKALLVDGKVDHDGLSSSSFVSI